MALAAETAARDSRRLQQHDARPPTIETDEKPVHRLSRPPQQQNRRKQHDGDCYRCGGKHAAARCKFKDYECHYCKKMGHLVSVCRKKKQDQNNAKPAEQTNRVEEPRSSDDEFEHEYSLYRLSSGSSRPITVQVTLNGKATEMEVDTGVFQDKLGTVEGVTATIHVDPTATPPFHRARPVPFALRAKVKAELE